MRLPLRGRLRTHSRGQGLVEFALILPLLVLLLVMALDFGRVFFGWVALHNSVRIGADFAAGNAGAWDGNPDGYQDVRDRYQELIVNDLQSLNCTLPSPDPVEDPVFSGFNDGDLVEVTVSCSFALLTPLAEDVLGGPVEMTVRSQFAIYRQVVAGIPGGGPPPPDPCSAPDALITTSPAESGGQVNINSGQSVTLTDSSTVGASCPAITAWEWDFGDGSPPSTDQGPHTRTYVNPGPSNFRNFTVSLTATNSLGSDTDTVVIRVRKP